MKQLFYNISANYNAFATEPKYGKLTFCSFPQNYGLGINANPRRQLGSTHWSHPQVGGIGARRRRNAGSKIPRDLPNLGVATTATERAEKILNSWAVSPEPEHLHQPLKSLQSDPQSGGVLLTGHYGQLI